ncbi:MAG: MMPL family transporter [Planctomycetota bacterium]
MHSEGTGRLTRLVTTQWRWVLAAWLALSLGCFFGAPRWKDIAYDGDFEYLPSKMSTVAATQVLNEAFPGDRSRSQIVLLLGRENEPITPEDEIVGDDLLRRLHHRLAEVCWQRAIRLGYEGGPIDQAPVPSQKWLARALEGFDASIRADEQFYEAFTANVPEHAPSLTEPRMAIAFYDRATLKESLGGDENETGTDYQDALTLVPEIASLAEPIIDRDLSAWESLIDILPWDDKVVGSRLTKPSARLTVMQLKSELAATGNIETVEAVNQLRADVLQYSAARLESTRTGDGLRLEVTGSAAIGGETLMAARDAIRYTEWITAIMILVILILVYRAPLLVAVPMISIGVAVVVSTGLVAILTDLSVRGIAPWLDMRVFTTSRIFIVVILFGAGTDYCLFLISRLREEARKSDWPEACNRALSGVTSALLGSALTTVFGLATLWFAEFGKYHYTGPIIAICLLIGLLVCLSLTPALLRAIGPRVFWPASIRPDTTPSGSLLGVAGSARSERAYGEGLWSWIAIAITRRPKMTFLLGVAILTIPGVYGWVNESSVTYDMSSQLDTDAGSRRGYRLLARHFGVGEVNPVTVLIIREDAKPRESVKEDIESLTKRLYEQTGVTAVRTSNDPLGDFPPGREASLFSADAWRRRALQQHRVAQNYFFSKNPEYQDRLVRLDVIVDGDPFSLDTAKVVSELGQGLSNHVNEPDSPWAGSRVLLAGTTPSIIDLRSVTIRDNQRIKVAVVIAVLLILVAVIRRVVLCLYLIATVLLSYYATIGLTVLFFRWVYGGEYVGLDWKLPLFLFVILVAVGQDYNVYLVTRIVEEQRSGGWLSALRRAVSRTGGIITACGMVMAATFISMTASAWFPALLGMLGIETDSSAGLRGIIELGFALGLGVLIDTFYVRTILVPSFVALVGRR